MRFKNIFIKGFGSFDDSIPKEKKLFKFSPNRINVIVGKNEQGKTTLMEALIDTIYGIPKERRDLRRPWGTHDMFSAVVELELKGKNYIIERNFSNHYSTVYEKVNKDEKILFKGNANPNGRRPDSKEFKKLLEQIGMPPKDVFEQLSFVTKFEMDTELSDNVRRLVTGGGADYRAILEELKSEYFKITLVDPWQARNKDNTRELEKLQEQKEELKARLMEQSEACKEAAKLEEDIKKAEEEIRLLQKSFDGGKFIKKQILQALEVRKELSHNNEAIASLLDEKSRVTRKIDELSKIESEIDNKYALFKKYGESLPGYFRELSKADAFISEVEKQSKDKKAEAEHTLDRKNRLEQTIHEEYLDICNLPDNFEELFNEYKSLKDEYENEYRHYIDKKKIIEDLEAALKSKKAISNSVDEMDEQLINFREANKEAELEMIRIEGLIEERRELEESYQQSADKIKEKYPALVGLPTDTESRLIEYIAATKIQERKRNEKIETALKIADYNLKIKHPLNFLIIPVSTLLMFFMAHYSQYNIYEYNAALAGFWFAVILTFLIVQKPRNERNKLEYLMFMLDNEIHRPIVYQDLVKKFPEDSTPDQLIAHWREYEALYKDIQKIKNRLEILEPIEKLTQRSQKIKSEMELRKEKFGIPEGVGIEQITADFRTTRKTVEKIKTEREILKDRYPSIIGETLPDIPNELAARGKKISEFIFRYPAAPSISSFDDIRDRLCNLAKLKGEIGSLDKKIGQIQESANISVDKVKEQAKDISGKLAPVFQEFGNDLNKLETEYKNYESLLKQTEIINNDLKSFRDINSIESAIREKTASGFMIDEKKKKLIETCPVIAEFAELDAEAVAIRTNSIDEEIDKIEKLILSKKEELNIGKIKLERGFVPEIGLGNITESIDELDAKIERLEIMRDGYREAVNILEESVTEFQETYRIALEEDISKMFRRIAGDKYQKIGLGSNFDMAIEAKSNSNVDRKALSMGTRDQLYFAMRIALAERLSTQIMLPFLLDDPFVFFDKNRLEESREILEEIAGNHQIIIFSHNHSYSKWGNLVCNLDEIRTRK